MNRLDRTMKSCAGARRKALVVYVTQGDPSPAVSPDVVEQVAAAGADVVELGVPFSDPCADGLEIQRAMQRALQAGGGLPGALDCVREVRRRGCEVPIVLFGYYNPIFVMGLPRFAAAAAEAGADAVLTVDVPVDELEELHAPLRARGLGVVPLVAPTSGAERMARLRPLAPAFVYYISTTGVTGAAFRGAAGGAERIAAIREASGAPVCVGFGIRTPDDARAVAGVADGVVVGSQVVRVMHEAGPERAAGAAAQYVAALRTALDS